MFLPCIRIAAGYCLPSTWIQGRKSMPWSRTQPSTRSFGRSNAYVFIFTSVSKTQNPREKLHPNSWVVRINFILPSLKAWKYDKNINKHYLEVDETGELTKTYRTGKVMSGPRNCHVNACQPRDSWHLGHPTCLKMMAKLPLIVLKRSRTGCRLRELRTMNPSNNQNFQSQLLEVDPYKNQHTCTPMLFPGPSAVDDQDHGEFTCEIC